MNILAIPYQTMPTEYQISLGYDDLISLKAAAETLRDQCAKHLEAAPNTPPTIDRRDRLQKMIEAMEHHT